MNIKITKEQLMGIKKHLLKENSTNLLDESPDRINSMTIAFYDDDSISFGFHGGKCYVGLNEKLNPSFTKWLDNKSEYTLSRFRTHNSIDLFYTEMGEKIGLVTNRRTLSYSGRAWLDRKIISFWNYPRKEELPKLLTLLSDEINRIYKVRISFYDFLIEIKGSDYEADLDDDDEDYEPDVEWQRSLKDGNLVPVSKYIGSKDSSETELNNIHLLPSDQKKNTPQMKAALDAKYKHIGNKLGGMTQAEYNHYKRYGMGESKNIKITKEQLMILGEDIINENIVIPVTTGDTIMTGKFKNKKTVVKDIDKDKHGMPTINGKQATTFRLKEGVTYSVKDTYIEKSKDILDDITDEKVGEEKYTEFKYVFDDGAICFGKIFKPNRFSFNDDFKHEYPEEVENYNKMDSNIARIISIEAPKQNDSLITPIRGSKVYQRVLNELYKYGVKYVTINLQSNDSRIALSKLVDKNILINPRNYGGISVDKHPLTFTINGEKVTTFSLKEGINQVNLEDTKIIDGDGNPLKVYRAQKNDRIQGVNRASNHKGIYFSADKESVSIYGDKINEYYLNIKNPIILKDLEWNLSVIPEFLYSNLISKGYDGAIWVRNGVMYEIVAFYENQVIPINNVNEATESDVNLSSFKPKNELNDKFWGDDKLKSIVRRRLLKIADDYIEFINLDINKCKDILFLGSLANYNWSRYSDVDLHILVDFKKINKDSELIKDYFDSKNKIWNTEHSQLKIFGYPVQVYVQDVNEQNASTGVYSIEKNKWLVKPTEIDDDILDKDKIKSKAAMFMTKIDDLLEKYSKSNDNNIESIGKEAKKLYDEIKKMRKVSLDTNKGEMSVGNITFKVLRRNKYIEKLLDLKIKTYDKINSLKKL